MRFLMKKVKIQKTYTHCIHIIKLPYFSPNHCIFYTIALVTICDNKISSAVIIYGGCWYVYLFLQSIRMAEPCTQKLDQLLNTQDLSEFHKQMKFKDIITKHTIKLNIPFIHI